MHLAVHDKAHELTRTCCGLFSYRALLARYALALLDRAEAAERMRNYWQRQWSEENANLDAVIADYAAKLAARDRTIAERDKSLAELRAELDETRRDIEDYDYLLQLQPLRELVEKWRAEKGKPDTMPDYGEMIRWIVDRAEAAEARLAEQAARIAELEDVLGWDKGRACACWREPGSDPDGPFNECDMHAGIRAALADARRDAERLRAALREHLEAERLWETNASEAFERQAEEFRRETGYLAPGKDVPAAMNPTDEYMRDRRAKWVEWNERKRDERHARWAALAQPATREGRK